MKDFVHTKEERLVGNGKPRDRLGCSDHEIVEFEIFRAMMKAGSKLSTLNFRTGRHWFLQGCLGIKFWREEKPRKAG